MNNVYLCTGNYAKKPFYVNFSDISLYSMEELCYYFIDRIYLLDYDIMNQQLVDWIRSECGMNSLADELDIYIRKHVSVAAFVTTILESTGLYDDNTIKQVGRILKEQAELSPYERLRKRAEYLYQTGRFRQAMEIYMEQVQIRRMYILANRKAMTDFDYGVFMRENTDWQADFAAVDTMLADTHQKWLESKEMQRLNDLLEERINGQLEQYHQQTGELIAALKQDYRRQIV